MLTAHRRPAAAGPATRLLVLCHGVGADGADLIGLADEWAAPGTACTAPDAPEPYDGAPFGRQWWSIGDRNPARMQAGAAGAAAVLDGFIDAELVRLGLPPHAYALMGFSQGAMAVLYAGLRRAVPPQAILAYSGALIGSVPPDRTAPVLLVHGGADEVVPPSRSRDAEAALQAAGVPVQAIYTPGLGHGIDPAGLRAGAALLARTA